MEQQQVIGQERESVPGPQLTAPGLAALLALAGSKGLEVKALAGRMRLTPEGSEALVSWLQTQYLVDVVSSPQGGEVNEVLRLTENGERFLLGLLEQMCELPEFR